MAEKSNYRYAVRKPIYEIRKGIKNRQSPTMTLLSNQQIPEANYYLDLGWIYGIPDPNPHIHEHDHDYDEIMITWGGNPEIPQVLGGEIEFYIGGQPITFNTTTGIFIPKGTPHGPLTWKKFDFPHIQMSLILGSGSYEEAYGNSGYDVPKKELPKKTANFDYEQYVIRSPMREAGGESMPGRQSHTMTYMSRTQINVVQNYIEFGWIWGIPPELGAMVHKKYDEIVLHIGGDPDNPEDLGADMEFDIGGEKLMFNTSYSTFIPKGVIHGPLRWMDVRKPHIEMAIMLGAGTMEEGWADSFFEKS